MSRATDEYLFALEQLAELGAMAIPVAETRFKYNAAKAILLHETGRGDLARSYATDAMQDAESLSHDETNRPVGSGRESFAAANWRLRKILRRS